MASIQKRPNGKWRARYRDLDGRERARHFERKVDAQTWLDQITASLVRGDYVDPKAGAIRFGVFARQWLAAQTFDESSREATATRLRVHLLPTFGDMELRRIKPSSIQSWLRDKSKSHAPAHVRVMRVNLSQILAAAVDDQLIVRNPCDAASVKAPKVEPRKVVPWSAAMVSTVVEEHPLRWRAIPALAAGCGLRQGEVLGLGIASIDFMRRVIRVEQQLKRVGGKLALAPPKGGKVREVPLPEVVAESLARHLELYPPGEHGLVFGNSRGTLVDRSSFNAHVWKPALRRAGIEPTRDHGMHILRHTYASILLDAGESIRAVAEYLGHADPGFTLRTYAHLMPASADRTRRVINEAYGEGPADSVRTVAR